METRRNFQISDLDTTDGGRPLASSARLLPPPPLERPHASRTLRPTPEPRIARGHLDPAARRARSAGADRALVAGWSTTPSAASCSAPWQASRSPRGPYRAAEAVALAVPASRVGPSEDGAPSPQDFFNGPPARAILAQAAVPSASGTRSVRFSAISGPRNRVAQNLIPFRPSLRSWLGPLWRWAAPDGPHPSCRWPQFHPSIRS